MTLPAWKTGLAIAGSVVAVALVAWPAIMWYEVRKLEKPKYAVVRVLEDGEAARKRRKGLAGLYRRQSPAELRQYAPILIAEAAVSDPHMRGAMSQGFRQVAGFIFGKNIGAGAGGSEPVAMTSPVVTEMPQAEPVAMTSPVVTEMSGGNTYRVSFVMPSKYTKDTLPRPTNANVTIREVPGRLVAAVGFYGNLPAQEHVQDYVSHLQEVAQAKGYQQAGPPSLLSYYPPFAPGWIRLNEVLLPVKEGACSS